jgi:hypothetical protein
MPVRVTYPGDPKARVVFIDTPGFDDTDVSDITILERVSEWLINTSAFLCCLLFQLTQRGSSYASEVKLAGIIYLHEITQARMRGSFRKNYEMFGELCGHKAMANVVAVSTKWDQIMETEAEAREEQLKKFWVTKLGNSVVAARFMHTYKSAWDIVDLLVRKERLDALQIQEELVDLEKALPDTAAGTTLQKQLQDALKEYENTVQQKRSAAAMQKGPDGHTPNHEDAQKRYEAAEKRLREAEQKLQAVLDQIQQLKIPISTRIMRFFGLG